MSPQDSSWSSGKKEGVCKYLAMIPFRDSTYGFSQFVEGGTSTRHRCGDPFTLYIQSLNPSSDSLTLPTSSLSLFVHRCRKFPLLY